MERGDHTGTDGVRQATTDALRTDLDELKTTPLLSELELVEVANVLRQVPAYEELPTFDLHHHRRTLPALIAQGFSFSENIRWWGARYATSAPTASEKERIVGEYATLAALWSGVQLEFTPRLEYSTAGDVSGDGAVASRGAVVGGGRGSSSSSSSSSSTSSTSSSSTSSTSSSTSSSSTSSSSTSSSSSSSSARAGGSASVALGGVGCALDALEAQISQISQISSSRARYGARDGAGGSARDGTALGTTLDGMRRPPVTGAVSGADTGSSARRFLVYQPHSGLGEWLVSLKNALAIARCLGRTLVVPHLLFDGSLQQLASYSSLFEMSSLLELSPGALEIDEFRTLGLRPTRLVMLHVKDPRLLPSRSYFDNVLGWANVSQLHVSSHRWPPRPACECSPRRAPSLPHR